MRWQEIVKKNYLNMRTVIIACNGPSLNDVDFDMANYFPIIALNRGYLKKDMLFDYLVVVNDLVIGQFGREIVSEVNKRGAHLFTHRDKNITGARNVVYLRYTPDVPSFQKIPNEPVWQGHTVTYVALQIAYWMGSKKVILVGLDHYYPDAENKPTNMAEFLNSDNSHFTSEYFSGKYWHTPNLRMSEIAYSLAKEVYEKDGRIIINASSSTRLDIFPKMSLRQALELEV